MIFKNTNYVISIICIIICIFLFEMYILFAYKKIDPQLTPSSIIYSIIERFKKNDTRSKTEILKDLNNKEINFYPNITPNNFLPTDGLKDHENIIFPLGGISNVKTILNNELGFYPLIDNDRYGFKNDDHLYNKKIDIAIIGDSYAESCCVEKKDSVNSILNRNYRTVTFGMGGNGPLTNYATLREYVSKLKPKIVLWFHCSNDLYNLQFELKSTILNSYLYDRSFSQNLIYKQELINNSLKKYLNDYDKIGSNKIKNKFFDDISEFDEKHIRKKFIDIIKFAKEDVEGWDGEFYFIYLPRFIIDETSNKDNKYQLYDNNVYKNMQILVKNYDFIYDTINKFNVNIIDFKKEVFDVFYFPKKLVPYSGGHYNERGYYELAKIIEKTIKNYK